MCAEPDVMRYMAKTMSREESSQQLSGFISHWEQRGFGLWAVEEKASGAFIGRIGLMVHDDWPEGKHKTEAGWMLDRPYWGRGLATEGALASVGYGFEELGLERIISITLPENAASRRVMGKAGLTYREGPAGGTTTWSGTRPNVESGARTDLRARELRRIPPTRSSENTSSKHLVNKGGKVRDYVAKDTMPRRTSP
jgi:hypothetical protein